MGTRESGLMTSPSSYRNGPRDPRATDRASVHQGVLSPAVAVVGDRCAGGRQCSRRQRVLMWLSARAGKSFCESTALARSAAGRLSRRQDEAGTARPSSSSPPRSRPTIAGPDTATNRGEESTPGCQCVSHVAGPRWYRRSKGRTSGGQVTAMGRILAPEGGATETA